MISRRTLTAIGAGAAAVTLLAGCSSTPSGGESPEGDIELRVLVNVTPNLTEEWWNELVAPFEEAHPGVDVVIDNPGAEGVSAAVPRLLAAGQAPDIVQSLAPTPDLAEELVDLSAYDWASGGPLADQYSIDGKYYMAGVGVQLQSLWFYNKDAFAQAGITDLPATVDELDDALGKLEDAGWTGIQTGGDWMSSHALQTLALPSIVGENPDWYADMSSGDVTFSESYGDYTELYADWIAKGYTNADALGVKYPDAEQSFLAGNAALYPMGSWFVGTEAKADDAAPIGVFRGPAVDGVDEPAMGANIASPYVIMKESKHQDAAADLVEFLTTDEGAVMSQLEVDGNYRDGYEYDMTELGKELLAIVADTPASAYTPTGGGYGERKLPDGYAGELNTQTQALLGGTSAADVDAAMDAWFTASIE